MEKSKEIKLIAYDLDGTFLDDKKEIPEENLRYLSMAGEKGIYPVVATGRLFRAVPEVFKKIPGARFFILINGAQVYDAEEDKIIFEANISKETALDVYRYGDTLDCIYDAYVNNSSYMTESMRDRFDEYMPDKNYLPTLKALRNPVDDLKKFIEEGSYDIQKLQYFFRDLDEKDRQYELLKKRYPELKITKSLISNIEINSMTANKGNALNAICEYLGISSDNTVSFGDGMNDLDMIIAAGTGIAVKNADREVIENADIVSEYTNNEAAVGKEIKKLLEL